MKKYAFLILAHTDPVQLKRLVHALDYEYFDFFIHIDKKQNIDSFEFEKYVLKYSKLFILENRETIYWGDISIVNATLSMYRLAFNKNTYSRFITLSGLDYPIASNKDIYNILSDFSKEYIMGNPIEPCDYHKIQCFHPMKNKYLNAFFYKLYNIFNISFKNTTLHLSNNEIWPIYFAPQWHALSYTFVEYMLDTIKNHPEILRYFKYTYAPDELLIPTIFFNSQRKNNSLKSNFPPETSYNEKTAIHHLNYSPYIYTYNESDFNEIITSNKLFLRKVQSGTSDRLIQMLDIVRQ